MFNLASEFRLSFGEPMTTSSFKEYPPRKLSYPTLKEKENLQTAKSIPQKVNGAVLYTFIILDIYI